jgi:AcrR family transcriptional regulator
MNRRSVRKVSTAKILKVALDLFSSKGYGETKMVDIAREAGLSVGALYLRFNNKENLCLALIEDQTKDYEELSCSVVRSCSDPVLALRDYISFCLGYASKKKQLISMLYREHRLQFLKPLRNTWMKNQQKLIEALLTDGIKKGIIRPLDTRTTALTIFASIRGAVLLRLIFGTGSPKILGESLFDLISNGIRKDGA